MDPISREPNTSDDVTGDLEVLAVTSHWSGLSQVRQYQTYASLREFCKKMACALGNSWYNFVLSTCQVRVMQAT